jgi:hypothetical protein
MPNPKGILAMIGTTQCTLVYVVNANQKSARGQMIAPYNPFARWSSGTRRRFCASTMRLVRWSNIGLVAVARMMPLWGICG